VGTRPSARASKAKARTQGKRTRGSMHGELRAQLAQQRSLEGLHLMRSKNLSLSQAAAAAGTTLRTMQRRVGRALKRLAVGRYAATKWDRIPRTMRFLTENGLVDLILRDSRQASAIATHMAAVDRYLRTGDTSALKPFRGKSIRVGKADFRFVTHPKTLERLAYAGEVSFEDLYALTTGESK
jgi:hypothetical protein